jgi:predicted ATPase
MMMESLVLQDFRCFAGYQEVPLRRLTLLVGENSSGKTSFLAATRIAEQIRYGGDRPDFNEEPFFLGAYDELANYYGGKAGRATAFVIGSTHMEKNAEDGHALPRTNTAEFVKLRAQPYLKCYKSVWNSLVLEMQFDQNQAKVAVRTPIRPDEVILLEEDFVGDPWSLIRLDHIFLNLDAFAKAERQQLTHLVAPSHRYVRPYATAPIRAQPRRTYDPLDDTPRPQGEHVPMLLAQIYGQRQWEELRQPLESFARAAGLFDAISVRRHGKNESGPFQIHVKLDGPWRNLIDVGYGVSQALPLLVELLRDQRERLYLIQQPEVHLHPRAQAELSSLFSSIATTHSKQLLIETHSDYIVDRFRMEVRNQKLKPSDVIVLYFERHKGRVTIHPLKLDERGNLLNVPPTYRQFFLQEEQRFLGVG